MKAYTYIGKGHFDSIFGCCANVLMHLFNEDLFLPEKLSPFCPKNIPINDGFCIFAKIRVLCQTINHA